MKLPEHLVNHAFEYLVVAVGGLAYLGFMAYMDLRHITRADWVLSEIREQEDEIERLTLYNEFGSEGNKPARNQVILRVQNRKAELERELAEMER